MKILFTFPGQGAQRPGMLSTLPAEGRALEEARKVLGAELEQLDSVKALAQTRAVQLCLLIAGVAWSRALVERGVNPDIVSGLSIGAFPAAVCSGALAFSDALRLVALRGELMQAAWPRGYGLTAISGLTRTALEPILKRCGAYLANLNAEKQIVIAGSEGAMKAAGRLALQAGANKVQRLAVSVPSHCELLDDAAAALAAAFRNVPLKRPDCAYLSGSSGRVLWEPAQIAADLAGNMACTVHWHEAMIAAYQRDARLAIEIPPGTVLSSLTRQAFPSGETLPLEQGGIPLARHLAGRLRQANSLH